jgi:hypothetical protein
LLLGKTLYFEGTLCGGDQAVHPGLYKIIQQFRGWEVYAGVEDLELNLAALSFPRTADANVHIMGYLWDWIDARDEEAMAALSSARRRTTACTRPPTRRLS